MEKILDFLKRNTIWIGLGIISYLLISPSNPEIKTLLLILLIESAAIGLSALAAFCFTKINFINEHPGQLGWIFMGVHVCVGFIVLGVYIAQFTV